jgi:hypothetical protein
VTNGGVFSWTPLAWAWAAGNGLLHHLGTLAANRKLNELPPRRTLRHFQSEQGLREI